MCDKTHLFAWHDAFTLFNITHPHVWHDSSICVTWHIDFVRHDSCTSNTLQLTATHCNSLQHTITNTQFGAKNEHAQKSCFDLERFLCNTLQHTATHCLELQHIHALKSRLAILSASSETHCSTLQHTATHKSSCDLEHFLCNTLQHTVPHCNTPQHTASPCNSL